MNSQPKQAKDIFVELTGNVPPEEWEDRLVELSRGDEELLARVRVLLRAHALPGSFLEKPAVEIQPAATEIHSITEKIGTRIGPYKLLQQVGEGGMGAVYMAEQKEPVKRRVALKIIKPGMDTRQVIVRFEAERQALAMMDHPNIARVLDAGQTESGRPYFVMELVNGISVTKYCDEQHLTPKERLEMFVPICQAVQHAHQKGIIHRDLKPSNILVALYDGQPVPKIIDFGVAKATSQPLTEKTMFTQLGQVVGTLEYMSPEQAERNQLDIDTRSDVYSLGVVLYELLTGDTPFDRTRLRSAAFDEMLRIIREEEPPRPSTKLSSSASLPSIAANRHVEPRKLTSTMRGEIDWIVMKALEKDRGRRYETANKFAEDIDHYLNDRPVVACPPSSSYQLRKFIRRNRTSVFTAGIAALLVVLGLAGTLGQLHRAVLAEENATRLLEAERIARAHANGQTEEAKTQSRALETILKFLNDDVLAQADPTYNTDRNLSLREALDRASQRIEGRFEQQPIVEARLRQTLGLTYLGLAEIPSAMNHLRRALKLCEKHRGLKYELTLAAINNMAAAYEQRGQYSLAEPLFRQSWTAMRELSGSDDEDTLICLNNLAWSIKMQGRLAEALPLFEQVLEARRRTLGEFHTDTLVSMNDVATVYLTQKRIDEAERLFETAVDQLTEVRGTKYPDTLRCMHNLAVLRKAQHRHDDAVVLFRETHALRQSLLGEGHASTLSTEHCLAATYQDMGLLEQAESHYLHVIEQRRIHCGPWHPDTFASLSKLAMLYMQGIRPLEAEPILRECYAILQHNQVQTLPLYQIQSRLGECLVLQAEQQGADNADIAIQQRVEAERLLLDAFEELARRADEPGPDQIRTAERLVALYRSWSKQTEVEKWQTRLGEIQKHKSQ